MKKIIKAIFIASTLLTSLVSFSDSKKDTAVAANEAKELQSKLIHYSDKDYVRYGANLKPLQSQQMPFKNLLEVHFGSPITAIEVNGDEVSLPSAIALTLITEGKYEDFKSLLAVQHSPEFRIRFKNGDSLEFHVFFNPSNGSCAYAQTGTNFVVIPRDLQCQLHDKQVRVGMTRAEVVKTFHVDGGICAPFRYERFVSSIEPTRKDNLVLKTNFSFKPAGMSDAVYYLGKWQTPQQSQLDTVMRISPPYLEQEFHD